MELSLAYTPCPNDTYMFYAIASGKLHLPDIGITVYLDDVETLNHRALDREFDVTKISFHAWLKVQKYYQILPVGAALGFGCGPLVISKKALSLNDIKHCRVALPGGLTTAHLLFQLWSPEQPREKIFVTYDKIFEMIETGRADCGVIIHESRFTYEQAGFCLIADLGAWWEEKTGLPIPLGCIAVRKQLPALLIERFEEGLLASIKSARRNPEGLIEYMKEHAQEVDEGVLRKHVDTYVNDFSLDLGAVGRAAVAKLEEMALAAGIIN